MVAPVARSSCPRRRRVRLNIRFLEPYQGACYVRRLPLTPSGREDMSTAATPLRVSVAIAAVTALAVTIGLALAGANVARSAAEGISSIDVLSNRADLVSGGDALVAVKIAAGTDPATVRVNLNG